MKGLAMAVCCPRCGHELEHRNGCTSGDLSIAIVGCRGCRREYEVTARIVPHGKPAW